MCQPSTDTVVVGFSSWTIHGAGVGSFSQRHLHTFLRLPLPATGGMPIKVTDEGV